MNLASLKSGVTATYFMDGVAVSQEESEDCELAVTLRSFLSSGDMPDSPLAQLLKAALKRFGTQLALAQAIGISSSRLGRVMKGGRESFEVENCLKLAKVAGLSPMEVLRAADKAEIADLLEDLLGPVPPRPPMPEESWPTMSEKARQTLKLFLKEVTPSPQPRKKTSRVRS